MANTRAPDTRIDLFISYHGEEFVRPNLKVRNIVERVVANITDKGIDEGALPSIFFDKDPQCLRGPVFSSICHALLETRGGGLGLCLLTKDYFRKRYCLTEMRALREMCRQEAQVGHSQGSVTHTRMRMRYICIDCSADDILNDEFVTMVDPEIGQHQLLDKIARDGDPIARGRRINFETIEAAAQDIAEMVWREWQTGRSGASSRNEHGSGDVLGATIGSSFARLSKIFGPADHSHLIDLFDMRGSYAPPDILGVLNAALNEHNQLNLHDISKLRTAIIMRPSSNTRRQLRAVDAYEQKWKWTNSLSWDISFIEVLFKQATKQLGDLEVGRDRDHPSSDDGRTA